MSNRGNYCFLFVDKPEEQGFCRSSCHGLPDVLGIAILKAEVSLDGCEHHVISPGISVALLLDLG